MTPVNCCFLLPLYCEYALHFDTTTQFDKLVGRQFVQILLLKNFCNFVEYLKKM